VAAAGWPAKKSRSHQAIRDIIQTAAVSMNPNPRTRTHIPKRTVSIIGTGSYVPARVMTNDDLAKIVETDDEWITSRTGIRERRRRRKHERHGRERRPRRDG
jgi:hypothetical protein